jgi:hypothetical protein
MRGRPLRISILVVQVVWLNAVLPGHTRGQVVLPGGETAIVLRTCNDPTRPCHSRDPSSPGRKARCAVCFFAIRMVSVPVIVLTAPEMTLLATLPMPEAAVPADAGRTLPERDRGPPAA